MAWIVSEGATSANLLTEDQALNNTLEVDRYLEGKGATLNAVAAICGNLWYESHINPGQWEIGYNESTSRGYGLVQWTPATKLINWAESQGLVWRGIDGGGDNQLQFLYENDQQWYPSYDPRAPQVDPPITFREFFFSDLPLETLTKYWYFYFEQPSYSDTSIPDRIAHAEKYYEYLSGHPPEPPEPPVIKHKKIPLVFWCKRIF